MLVGNRFFFFFFLHKIRNLRLRSSQSVLESGFCYSSSVVIMLEMDLTSLGHSAI